MLRFILVVLANVKRGPYLIPKMRKMFHHPERYSEQVRYAFAQKLINYMKSSGKIKTEVYGTENLPLEGGYVMYPNHQGKYDALGIIYAHKQPCSFVMDKAKSNSFLVKELVDMLGAKSDKILPLSMRSQRKSSRARNTSCFQKVVMIGIATRYSNLSREVLNVRFVPKHRSYRLH